MGMLSIRLKPNFLGLLKFLNSMNWLIIFFSLINLSMCIYEDQIGKFDWRQTYVGRIKFSHFDTVSTAKKIIVATEENVLAALNLKTGQVVWRHVFENSSPGDIQLLHYSDGEKVTTVTGSNPYLVRGWDPATGVLLWEWPISIIDNERAHLSEWWVQNGMLVHLLPAFGSHLEVTMYNLMTGANKGVTSKLPAVWTNDGCILTPPYYTCISGSMGNYMLLSLDVTSNAVQIISKPLSNYFGEKEIIEGNLRSLDGKNVLPGFIIDDKKVLLIKNNEFEQLYIKLAEDSTATLVEAMNELTLIQASSDENKGFALSGYNIATGKEIMDLRITEPSLHIPEPEILGIVCINTAREQPACRILINGADDALHLMQQGGRIIWCREEALANIVAVEFVDLPVSETDAALESEFDQKEAIKVYSSVWAAFVRRLYTQYQQLQTLLQNWQGEGLEADSPTALVRDYFNLHKIIVLITDVGKIYGMDNLSGEILWRRYDGNLNTESVVMYTRRTARHPPHDAYITIIGKHEETGNGYIISLNPIRGTLVGERALQLDVRLQQVALLHVADTEKLYALVLLDEDETVQVLPLSAAPLVRDLYMYVADRDTGKMQGYTLRYNGKQVIAQRTWSLNLGGSGARIVTIAGKSRNERVHSAGKPLADRSVLYKYSNPNLVLVLLERPDPVHKDVVTAVAVDGACGAVVAASTHRRARALPLAVHADNTLAYLYRSDKHRRLEIATMELYEGKERWLSAGTQFSSFACARAPSVERQAYILPGALTALAFTTTERAITDTHILLALSTGKILELPWSFVEPRRPLSPTGEHREEGLIPYAPEVPLPSEASLNYNQTTHRVRAIYTAPSGLESTSLVLATGLDIFYTRVAPSKTFDLLKDDFDYHLITIVLGALIIASYSTKYFASRKMLKQAWK
ncbi:ER membrane protein complex subunit 1 isoform X1 [Pieris brassicae]|uniref:ER membrane protein complex subunit 1 isoform X1 n=1 Tax=Pieris brassicae TaxID=7116 RepID=UPI001E65E5CD|nr:ER membrane protein complex subunit 1 isoform X1 [Pieris brassicae]